MTAAMFGLNYDSKVPGIVTPTFAQAGVGAPAARGVAQADAKGV